MLGEPRSLKELFLTALAIAPAERAAWLERECGPDAELRRRVELMLAAHDTPQSLLDRLAPAAEPPDEATGAFAAVGPERPSSAERETVGAVIGPYKVVQEIGEGGMGKVYMVQQTEPVKRLVALKVIKPGMDSKQVLARFEAERQALALMDHPNIARVLDAGATAAGRPYFAMELVKGVPITRYCDEHHLTPRLRLELFIPVCQAIQHAHQKGIIHRDIKPTNVLVAQYDSKPVPKVIDFGVAKATGQQLTDRTLVTGFGAVIGTLEYMSPEQAELNQSDIDTRSDIYSLGVLLYELLTGTTPLERKRLKAAAMLEVLRLIREEEAPRPSTRLSSTEELPSIAVNRGLKPKSLSGLVRGELDWIVMKALEKERNRRYETADALAADLLRYLNDEAVQACPPSMLYRFRKFTRRNKAALTTAAVVLVALLLGTVISIWQAVRATGARDRAETAENNALADRDRAKRAERRRTDQLWQAQVARAEALRWSGNAGRRFEGLQAVRDAAGLVRDLYADDSAALKQHLAELRNEAIACLALPDLTIARRWNGNPPGTTAVALDAPFQRYARADGQGHVSLRAVEGDREIRQLACFAGPVAALCFSPDDRFLAARSGENLCVWDLQSSAAVLQLRGKFTEAFDFSRDGHQAAVGQEDGAIVFYDLSTGQESKRLPRKQRSVGIRFNPDGQQLAVCTERAGDDNLKLLTIATGQEAKDAFIPGASPVVAFAYGPDGRQFAVGDAAGGVLFYEEGTGHFPGLSHQAEVLDVAFNHGGDMVASVSRDGTICLWDPRFFRLLHAFVVADVTRLQFSADDRFLGVGLSGSEIRLYEVAPGRERSPLNNGGRVGVSTWSVQISPDGRLLAAGDTVHINLFDLATGKECCWVETGMYVRNTDRQHSSTALFHPDGKSLLTSGPLGGLQRWPITVDPKAPNGLNIGPPLNLGILPPGSGTAGRMALTPDGRTLAASLDWGGGAMVLDLEGKGGRTTLPAAPGTLDVAISPDARWVATGTYLGGGARVYDAQTGRLVRELPGGDANVAFSPDGQWLVTSTVADYRFWHTGSWEEGRRIVRELGGRTQLVSADLKRSPFGFPAGPELGVSRKDHGRPAGPLAFSADGKVLALASSPWKVRLIDSASGDPLATMEGPDLLPISALCFTPDGSRLVVASEFGTIDLWDLAAIHRQLVALKLDWGLPVPQAAPEPPARPALGLQMVRGDTVEERRQAVALCRKLVADLPSWENQWALVINLNQFGVACDANDQLQEAEQAYREALDIVLARIGAQFYVRPSDWPIICGNLGRVLQRRGRYQEAEQTFRKVISTVEALVIENPNSSSYGKSLGDLYQNLGDVLQFTGSPQAEQAFRQALENEEKWANLPKAVETHLRLAHLLASQGQWEKAAKEYPAALDPPPGELDQAGHLTLWCEYASVLLLRGDNDGYQRVCRQVLERYSQAKPYDAKYMVARIVSLAPHKITDPDQVVRQAQEASGEFRQHPWVRHTLAVASYRAGRFESALEQCQQSMKLDPAWRGHVVNWLLLAMAHQRLGHAKEAREWLDKATEWNDKASKGKPKPSIDQLVWCDRLELQLLLREAEELLRLEKKATPK
jgi:serine/threonine protein kinase/WD40 repeat protein/tetratricopeptide (TPR) repeat protein